MRSWILSMLMLAACVNDAPSNVDAGPKEGKLDGPCHDNGSCDDGLVCVAGIKRCAPPSSSDATTESGPADTGSDAPADADANTCSIPQVSGIRCPNTNNCTPFTQQCCVKNGAGTCVSDNCMALSPVDIIWRCDRKSDCAAMNGECCVDNMVLQTNGCPFLVTNSMSKGTYCTMSGSKCANSNMNGMLCANDGECAGSLFGSKCMPTMFVGGGTNKLVGVCQP